MKKRKVILCAVDMLIAILVYSAIAVVLNADLIWSMRHADTFETANLFICLTVFCVLLFVFRLSLKIYTFIWRYAWSGTYLRLIAADFLTGISMCILAKFFPVINIGFIPIVTVVTFSDLGALSARFIYQFIYTHKNAKRIGSGNKNNRIIIAIVGAGSVGASFARELIRNPRSRYSPYCFIDTDPSKRGLSLNGLPVYYEDSKIIDKIKTMPVQEIVIAIGDLEGADRKRLFDFYRKTGCKVRLYDYSIEDSIRKGNRSLRDISIEDLLFRETIKLDDLKSKDFYYGKTVLVTGGGGSIGSELCRQISRLSPGKLVIFDIYENNAYDIQQELLRLYKDKLNIEVFIGSVRDVKRLDEIFDRVRPDVVIHAAAHKHVPLMEGSSVEAVKNNVIGTYNTANVAEKYNVSKFVLISTDKAVNPTNIMGASKRLCEMIIQSRRESDTSFVAVRFGNVLGSNGSVIPLFRKQIENGGPVTVTDKRIIRYFMTIPEAAQLVLEAGAMAAKGELYVLDMGEPVRIYDLAYNMIRLSGLKPGEDIDIVEIGLRPGEKLYEELLMKSEELDKTENSLIFIERDKPYTRQEVEDKLEILRNALDISTNEAVKEAIRSVVPTYYDPKDVNSHIQSVK